jgi:hypothetical protein
MRFVCAIFWLVFLMEEETSSSRMGNMPLRPYISPFGDISGWASITGESARGFSRDMLSLSKEFWQEMGLYNQRRMTTDDLCKPIVFWPDQKDLVVALNQLIHESRHDAPFACAL